MGNGKMRTLYLLCGRCFCNVEEEEEEGRGGERYERMHSLCSLLGLCKLLNFAADSTG